MKKYTRLVVAMAAGCCMLQVGHALAGTLTVRNSIIYFDGCGNGINDTRHRLGSPMLTDLQVTWDDNSHFVHSGSQINTIGNGIPAATGTAPDNGLYSGNDPSGPNYTTVSSGYADSRVGHPNGNDNSNLTLISNAFAPSDPYQTTIDGTQHWAITYNSASLSSDVIAVVPDFVIAYTPYCENDALLNTGKVGDAGALPAPMTMMIFGLGMVGLAGCHLRRTAREQ